MWFRNPLPYFHDEQHRPGNTVNYSRFEGFFSDDGQRSHRYTPFFANSGFYYLYSSPHSIALAWSIMTSFDIVQVGGSHQNVLTMRLMEGLAMAPAQVTLLSLWDFPTGMLYHHNPKFMKKLANQEVHPYHFHM